MLALVRVSVPVPIGDPVVHAQLHGGRAGVVPGRHVAGTRGHGLVQDQRAGVHACAAGVGVGPVELEDTRSFRGQAARATQFVEWPVDGEHAAAAVADQQVVIELDGAQAGADAERPGGPGAHRDGGVESRRALPVGADHQRPCGPGIRILAAQVHGDVGVGVAVELQRAHGAVAEPRLLFRLVVPEA